MSRILPQFLDDFFPPQDVMNKVIGEFLSNQQPYPQFMATVVYKVSGITQVNSNMCKMNFLSSSQEIKKEKLDQKRRILIEIRIFLIFIYFFTKSYSTIYFALLLLEGFENFNDVKS